MIPGSEAPICRALWRKISEQIERIGHLTDFVPQDKNQLSWNPNLPHGSTDLGHLLGHLLDCLAGFCAVFYAAFPESCGALAELKALPVNHFCSPQEARERLRQYAGHLERAFANCTDNDLSRMIPSVFVPAGESLMTLLLGNLEHLISHKYQLFMYLKILGLPVGTRDLYQWRGTKALP